MSMTITLKMSLALALLAAMSLNHPPTDIGIWYELGNPNPTPKRVNLCFAQLDSSRASETMIFV